MTTETHPTPAHEEIRESHESRRVSAFTDDALGTLDATGVAAAIRAGEISAGEAVEAAIARVAQVDSVLGATTVDDHDRARRRAAHVPQGTPFGWTATTERPGGRITRNPWATGYSSGGSSGGTAALVASGALPIAHGNDGGGSIRIPAAACGLVGLKVTRGRLLGDPSTDKLPVQLVVNGVLTRTVRDTAAFLAAAEQHQPARTLPPVGLVEGPGARRLRIGMMVDSPLARATDPQTREAVEAAAAEADAAIAKPPKSKKSSLAAKLRGRATARLSTDDIMKLTRGA